MPQLERYTRLKKYYFNFEVEAEIVGELPPPPIGFYIFMNPPPLM